MIAKEELQKINPQNIYKWFSCLQVGEWSTEKGLNITNHAAFHEFGTTNITLRVTTIEVSAPF